jgi:hypothetical protein
LRGESRHGDDDPERALTQRLTSRAPEKLAAVERALCFAVGLV